MSGTAIGPYVSPRCYEGDHDRCFSPRCRCTSCPPPETCDQWFGAQESGYGLPLWRCRGCSWSEGEPGDGVEEHEALSGHWVDMPGSTRERATASRRLSGWTPVLSQPTLADTAPGGTS